MPWDVIYGVLSDAALFSIVARLKGQALYHGSCQGVRESFRSLRGRGTWLLQRLASYIGRRAGVDIAAGLCWPKIFNFYFACV